MSYLSKFAFQEELNYNAKLKLWNKQILEDDLNGFKKFDYNSYLHDDLVLRNALSSILEYGAVVIEKVNLSRLEKIE